MTPSEKKVLVLLALLAEQSGDKVSEARLDFIAEELVALGADKACVALKKLLESARRFPTVQEVKNAMGLGELTARDLGNEIASVIIAVVGRVGIPPSPRVAHARDTMLGPAALYIVDKLGGWNAVVEQSANTQTFRAQVRDLAESYAKQGHITPEDVPRSIPSYGEALALADKHALPGTETGITIKEIPF